VCVYEIGENNMITRR